MSALKTNNLIWLVQAWVWASLLKTMVYREGEKVSDEAESATEGEDSSESALIPKSLVAGKDVKPGDTILLKVVHEYEDELEVQYAHEGSEGEPGGDEMAAADAQLESMAT